MFSKEAENVKLKFICQFSQQGLIRRSLGKIITDTSLICVEVFQEESCDR